MDKLQVWHGQVIASARVAKSESEVLNTNEVCSFVEKCQVYCFTPGICFRVWAYQAPCGVSLEMSVRI